MTLISCVAILQLICAFMQNRFSHDAAQLHALKEIIINRFLSQYSCVKSSFSRKLEACLVK